MNPNIQRAYLLMEQNRFADAEKELVKALSVNPENPVIYALLAECLIQQNNAADALEMADNALRLDAGNAYFHSVSSKAHLINKDLKAARTAIDRAIEIEPFCCICSLAN